jgi:hydrogenase large subunit
MATNEAYSAPEAGGKVKISVDPLTRIEGHLKIEVTVENGKVVDAVSSGTMFRGFEQILIGRDPRDASQITQRICGVCPTAHATASTRALDDAFGVKDKITTNGRLARNLIFGSNYLQSHILHFYHLAALDYVKGPETAFFIPRYAKPDLRLPEDINKVAVDQYVKALTIRAQCHELVCMFGGKMPHVAGIVVGGATEVPTKEKLALYLAKFKDVEEFITKEYIPTVYLVGTVYKDLFSCGAGWKNCVSYGVFPMDDKNSKFLLKPGAYVDGKDVPLDTAEIKEYVKYSWYDPSCSNLHPSKGKTVIDLKKKGAYSFVKAPRYMGKPCEGGPLARMWVANPDLSPIGVKELKDKYGIKAKKFRDLGDLAWSIMGRHVARAEETYIVMNAVKDWLKEIKPGKETIVPAPVPASGEGMGLTEAPRGALLHYVNIKDSKIANYQAVPATIWNCSPRDDMDQMGPVEKCLIGVPVPDIKNPVNVGRLVRAFDP